MAVVAQAARLVLVGALGDALDTWFEACTIRRAQQTNGLQGMPMETSTALVQAVDAKVFAPSLERVVEANTLLESALVTCRLLDLEEHDAYEKHKAISATLTRDSTH